MPLELKTITFNHDPASSATAALNVRRNKDFEVPTPEHDGAIARPLANAAATYSIADTSGQNPFVRVKVGVAGGTDTQFEVRAHGGGVLGSLDPVSVSIPTGSISATVDMLLAHRSFAAVGSHDVTWRWQYRVQGAPAWQPLATTQHRIYLVLMVPGAPWTQTFADKRNPWTDLLEHACAMAAGAKTATNAGRAMAKAIHGNYAQRYDIVSGTARYGYSTTGTTFHLSNWIEYVLRGNPPAVPVFCQGTGEEYPRFKIVNCYDCAASLALMAKVVGAPADYYFHQPFGKLHYVEPIGRDKCNNPFYGCSGGTPAVGPDDTRTGFGNHAYVKLSGAKNFDACMREWLTGLQRVVLIIIWLIVLILTFGTVNLTSLRDRADGWLVDVDQAVYEQRTIDTSTPYESTYAGGAPVLQTLTFSVT
jgi:hypothetical protein